MKALVLSALVLVAVSSHAQEAFLETMPNADTVIALNPGVGNANSSITVLRELYRVSLPKADGQALSEDVLAEQSAQANTDLFKAFGSKEALKNAIHSYRSTIEQLSQH